MIAILNLGWELALIVFGPVFGCWYAWRRKAKLAAATFAILGGLLWAAVIAPSYPKARLPAQRNSCITVLKMLAEAKKQWASQIKPEDTAVPETSDVAPFLKGRSMPTNCPGGGTYTLGAVNEPPRCSLHPLGHALEPTKATLK